MVKNEFKNPGTAFRGLAFWSWNGKMEPEKLRAQIRSFRRIGLGGFFMHSRVGLETPYLGREWFECVHAAVGEAQTQSLIPCLYDEDRWASGAAGGLVTCDPRFRAWVLYLRFDKGKAHPNSFGFWSAVIDNGKARDLRFHGGTAPETESSRAVFEIYADEEPRSDWFNGYTYLDVLDREAVGRFLQVTYEKYRENLGALFGGAVPAIFTDEPHYWRYLNAVHPGLTAPWTRKLPELFRQRFDYSLVEHLPELFFDCPDREYSPARYHYWLLLTERFVDSFSRQVGAWCEKNGIALTGHLLWEDTLTMQTRCVGAAMRHYPYMQIPGIDQLTEYSQLYDACKQLASAARQFERPLRISEVYGCTGWDMTFAGYKAMADWQYALGINRRCLHLSFYTMAGEAKRDYPASFSPHSSFAGVLKYLEDYFARLGVILSRGREVRDLLVIHPVESAWVLINHNLEDSNAFDRKLAALRNHLLDLSLDFDYGDEEHLIARGMADGESLRLGAAVYKAVLLPEMKTIRAGTLRLLRHYRDCGGVVAACGAAPALVDGMPSGEAEEFWRELPRGIAPVEQKVRRVRLSARDGSPVPRMLYQLRESEAGMELFLCNTGFEAPVPDEHHVRVAERTRALDCVRLEFFTDRAGHWCELIPESGETVRVEAERNAAGYRIETAFAPLQSRIFRFSDQAAPEARKQEEFHPVRRLALNPPEWPVTRDEPNVLVLDHAAWKLGDGKWHARDFIMRVDDAIRRELDAPVRGGRMKQPWAVKQERDCAAPLEMEYRFRSAFTPEHDLFLAVEQAEQWRMECNGEALAFDPNEGYWVDESIQKVRIRRELIRSGENILRLGQVYHSAGSGLEALYLLGEFSVESDILQPPVRRLRFGDWGGQGFPYYAGNMVWRTFFRHDGSGRVRLRIGEHAATALRILVDGREAGILGWAPYELDLGSLPPGEHELGIEVVGSRRNAFGPFFLANPHPSRFGAAEFREYAHPEYRNLTPYGLFSPPELLLESVPKAVSQQERI